MFQGLELRLRLTTITLRSGQSLGTGREPGVVGIEVTTHVGLATARLVQLDTRHLLGAGACFEVGRGDPETFLGLFQGRRGGATADHADAPARRTEPITIVGDHHCVRIGDGDVDRVGPRRDADGGADDGVEQLGHTGLAAAHVRAHRDAGSRWHRRRSTGRTEGDDGSVQVRGMERLERSTPGARRGDHDRFQGFAERGLDGRFPAGVDVDQVEQRAEHIFDAGEMFGTGAGPRTLEGEVERLGPSTPARRIVGRSLASSGRRLERTLGGKSTGLGSLEVCHQTGLDRLGLLAFDTESLGIGVEPIDALAQQRRTGCAGVAARPRPGRRRYATSAARHAPLRRHWPPNC